VSEAAIVAIVVSLITAVAGIIVAIVQTRNVKKQQDEIHHEVKNNGGSSMKDAVDRIEKIVLAQAGDIKAIDAKVDMTMVNVEHLRERDTEIDRRVHDLEGHIGGRRRTDPAD